jgi:hypothetical protein
MAGLVRVACFNVNIGRIIMAGLVRVACFNVNIGRIIMAGLVRVACFNVYVGDNDEVNAYIFMIRLSLTI